MVFQRLSDPSPGVTGPLGILRFPQPDVTSPLRVPVPYGGQMWSWVSMSQPEVEEGG